MDGLGHEAVQLEGQLLPGLSLVRSIPALDEVIGELEPIEPLPVITFPGNLGEEDTLTEAWRWLEGL